MNVRFATFEETLIILLELVRNVFILFGFKWVTFIIIVYIYVGKRVLHQDNNQTCIQRPRPLVKKPLFRNSLARDLSY